MASTTMTSLAMPMSFLSSNRLAAPTVSRRSVIVASAARTQPAEVDTNGNGKRRELMFAAAAAALCSVAGMAVAEEEEPKRGSPEAKKKYAPVCVTMPTARICRN